MLSLNVLTSNGHCGLASSRGILMYCKKCVILEGGVTTSVLPSVRSLAKSSKIHQRPPLPCRTANLRPNTHKLHPHAKISKDGRFFFCYNSRSTMGLPQITCSVEQGVPSSRLLCRPSSQAAAAVPCSHRLA